MPVDDASPLAFRAAQLLLDRKEEMNLPNLRIVTQQQFLQEADQLDNIPTDQKLLIIDQTERVLRYLYAHLPFKKVFQSDDPNVNPLASLAALRQQVDTLSDFDFHTCMLIAMAGARDIHTIYIAPSPYRGAVAFLPFQVRFHELSQSQRRFLVTKTMATNEQGGFDHPHFRKGAEIVEWDGLVPAEATMVAAQLQPGANPDAEMARGAARLTARNISTQGVAADGGIPPFQPRHTVRILYTGPGEKKVREISFPWQVATGFGAATFSSTAFSHSEAVANMQRWNKCSYRPEKVVAAKAKNSDFLETQFPTDPPASGRPHPDLLRCPKEPGWPIGYLRIRNFASDGFNAIEDARFREIRDLLARFDREAPGGLIIDIRENGGGLIRIAERMLQLLSPRHILPLQFHFPRTPVVEEVFQILRGEGISRGEFAQWLNPLPGDDDDPSTPLTPGRTLTPEALANDTGQVYQSPVVLIFDALTYSAADMFAAGFQDHEIGETIGVDCSTGGGGANAWSYTDIIQNLPPLPGLELPRLPGDCSLSVAVRRCTRTGPEPLPIEEIGVAPHHYHPRTSRDILNDNADLFEFAVDRLIATPIRRINIRSSQLQNNTATIQLSTVGIRFVAFRADGQVIVSGAVRENIAHTFSLPIPQAPPLQLQVEGYWDAGELEKGLPPLAAPRISFS